LEGYPVELCKALAVTWLFAGLRNNEILRLRLGCIRWQKEDASVQNSGEILSGGAVCMLDVPVNKTSAAFTKPVDPIVGEMISVWEKVRPNGVKLPELLEQRADSYTLPQGRSTDGRCSRQHHEPSRAFDDCLSTLQRQRADDAVRITGVARPQHAGGNTALRQDHTD
jgi:integrase